MSPSPADLATLSRLLDDALDLPPPARDVWLAARPDEHAHLLPLLREMLAEHGSLRHVGYLAGGPRIGADARDESAARAGERVGPYRLIREIGHGGMGTVWLSDRDDGGLKRPVALKLPRLAWGDGLAERMARERDIGALLEHPNIARLYDAGVDALGRPYLALEYIDGQPLDAWCKARDLPLRERLRLFLQVTRAVAYAHGRLVVHRDLKPSNVLVTADGQARLLDFGIAKLLHDAAPGDERLTQEQGRVLTPHFASPEQLRGEVVTVASDVYSLGVLLYELLSGRLPHAPARQSLGALEEAVLEGEPALASQRAAADRALSRQLRGELDAILSKALQRDPTRRYATADAFAADIERHLAGERVLARPDSVGYRWGKALRRHRVGFAAAGAVLLAVLAGSAVSLVEARRANDAAERAAMVQQFVVDLFRVNERGNPGNAELRRLPAELLLERGAKLIETRFPGQPRLRAELYGVVGGIFADMGANELATDYASRQVQALVAAHAGPSALARATMLQAQALLARGLLADAQVRARGALALAEPDAELRPRAMVLLASVLLQQSLDDEASRLLDRAEADLRRAPGPATGAVSARAKAIRASLLAQANRFDAALPLYLAAIDEALAAEGPLSPAAIDLRLALAHGLVVHEYFAEARPHREAALAALRASGGPGDVRAALAESSISATLFGMGRIPFTEAREAIERGRAALAARGPLVPEPIKAMLDLDLGGTLATWGDLEHAEPLIAASATVLRPIAEAPGRRFRLASEQGALAMYAGRHAQADAFLREQLEMRQRLGAGRHPFAAFDHAGLALNLQMQGRFDEAQAVLYAAPVFDEIKGARTAPLAFRQGIDRALAKVKLERGDATSALALLPPEETDVDLQFPFDEKLLRGEVLCAVGRRAEGLRVLEEDLAFQADRVSPHHPELARARAVTGLCALEDGQHKRAAELAGLARAAFIAQPGVSPYFKRPAEALDRRLGVRVAIAMR